MPPMDKALAARRLAAALGAKISPDELMHAFTEAGAGWVYLLDGRSFRLAGGNTARDNDGKWWRNGKRWRIEDDDPNIRPLSEQAGTMTRSGPVQSPEWRLPYNRESPDDRTARQQAPVERAPDNDPEGG